MQMAAIRLALYVNVTGETLVLNKVFPRFMPGKSLLYSGKPYFPKFSGSILGKSLLYAGKILV